MKPALSLVPTAEKINAQEDWEMQDQEVISWVITSMESHIAEMYTYQETTKKSMGVSPRNIRSKSEFHPYIQSQTRITANQIRKSHR
jgi:hypothetical protein